MNNKFTLIIYIAIFSEKISLILLLREFQIHYGTEAFPKKKKINK